MKNISRKQIIIIGGFFMVSIFVIFLILRKESKTSVPVEKTPPPTTSRLASFQILTTNPANGAVSVFPGEIQVSFTTDTQIESTDDFSLNLSPIPPLPPKLITDFPTTDITYQILGGLKADTNYTVTVKNKYGKTVSAWGFKTSTVQPESSSGQAAEEQRQLNNKYYPLFDFVPYDSESFQIDYTGRLTLRVIINNKDIENTKKEVIEWIKSKGIDPSTHTITYTNGF